MVNVVDELAVSVAVSREGTTALELDAPGTYDVVEVGPGARTWRRATLPGRYVHGRTLVDARLEVRSLALVVRVHGDTWGEVRTRAQAMIDAVSAFAYTVTVTLDGVADTYVAEPADVAIVGGDTWQKHHMMARQQEYQLTIPVDPVRTSLP